MTLTDFVDESGNTRLRGQLKPPAGGAAGAERVIAHPFDFTQAAALAAGVAVWTPAVGDLLLDARITGDPWTADGAVTPYTEVGIITAGAFDPAGLFAALVGPLPDLSSLGGFFGAPKWEQETGNSSLYSLLFGTLQGAMGGGGNPYSIPVVRFLTADPLKLVVSGDGSPSGAPFDGSAGSAVLYLTICTPTVA